MINFIDDLYLVKLAKVTQVSLFDEKKYKLVGGNFWRIANLPWDYIEGCLASDEDIKVFNNPLWAKKGDLVAYSKKPLKLYLNNLNINYGAIITSDESKILERQINNLEIIDQLEID